MSGNQDSQPTSIDDPGLLEGVKYTLAGVRARITSSGRASDMSSFASRTSLGEVERKLGNYSFVQLFRRHMTIARQALLGGVRYLKVNVKQDITPIALARCAVENAGVARWLAEEDNTTIVQRSIERYIDNYDSERRMLNLFSRPVPQYAKAKKDAILKFAEAEGIDLAHLTSKRGTVSARPLTLIMEDLDARFAKDGGEAFGNVKSPWTLSSAIVHGAEYPSIQFQRLVETDDNGQMIGLSPIILGGFFEAAITTYERAIGEYDRLLMTPGVTSDRKKSDD